MAYDPKYFEYQMGRQHGYSAGVYGSLGASHRIQPPKPWTPPPPIERKNPTVNPVHPTTGHILGLDMKAKRPETGVEKMIRLTCEKAAAKKREEERRRSRQLNIITRKPRYWLSLKGHVHSFLDDAGRPFLDDDGEFRLGEVVPHKIHLRRLRRAYLSHWQGTLEIARTCCDPNAIHRLKDAEERLSLAKSGLYVSPVAALGSHFMVDLFQETRCFRWSWIRRRKEHRVGLAEYDRRMRIFFRRGLSGSYAELVEGEWIASLNGAAMVRTFLENPHTRGVKPRKGRQFRPPRVAAVGMTAVRHHSSI